MMFYILTTVKVLLKLLIVIALSCPVLVQCMCNVIQGPPLWAFVKISRGIPRLNSPDLGSRTRGKCVKLCRAAGKEDESDKVDPCFRS